MMDAFGAMGIAAAILLPVVILTLFISIVTVKRGEMSMHGGAHAHIEAHGGAAAAALPGAKPAVAAPEEISVIQILLLGAALFGVAMLILFGISALGALT